MEILVIFIILIVIVVFGKFFLSLNKDNEDLRVSPIEEKFDDIVYTLNNAAFGGKGTITKIDKREFNLYESKQNQHINFNYSTGNLTITWRYKYFQKEIVHTKTFSHVRNLSLFEQQKIADIMISEMNVVKQQHQQNVLDVDSTPQRPVVESSKSGSIFQNSFTSDEKEAIIVILFSVGLMTNLPSSFLPSECQIQIEATAKILGYSLDYDRIKRKELYISITRLRNLSERNMDWFVICLLGIMQCEKNPSQGTENCFNMIFEGLNISPERFKAIVGRLEF